MSGGSAAPAPTPAGSRPWLLDIGDMRDRAAEWDRLVGRAAYPNPHFSRHVIEACLQVGLVRELRFVAVERGGELIALLPFEPHGVRVGLWHRAHRGLSSPYIPNGTPLIAGDDLAAGAGGLAAALVEACWLLPLVAVDSLAGRALRAALAAEGLGCESVGAFDRPVLDRSDPDILTRGRRRDLDRRRRRMAGLGRLEAGAADGGSGLAEAVETFLDLEARGWKGRRGTALAARPETARFARLWFAEGSGPVRPRADWLALDGRPIAVSLALVAGGTATLLKAAFDEGFRAYAPGLLLEQEIIRTLRETGFAERLDSATLAGHVLGEFYAGREAIADLLVAPPALGTRRFARLATTEHQARAARDGAKRLVRALIRPSRRAR